MNDSEKAQFIEATRGAECLADVQRKLPDWNIQHLRHFDHVLKTNIPLLRPSARKSGPAAGVACPKGEIPQPKKKGATPAK